MFIECAAGERMWMLISIFVALPAVGLSYINAKRREEKEHHSERPQFVPYPHLRIRSKVVYANKYTFMVLVMV